MDQRLPEEPVLEDEQQLEKKLPGNLHSSSLTSEVFISEAEISLMTFSCVCLAALERKHVNLDLHICIEMRTLCTLQMHPCSSFYLDIGLFTKQKLINVIYISLKLISL